MLLLVVFLFAAAGNVSAAPADEGSPSPRARVVIQDSERHEIVSGVVDDTFKVHVYLPRGYHDMKDPIPAVYLLDAEYSFGAVAYAIRRLIKDRLIPPVLLVGVAYEVSYDDYYKRRERDFTPTAAHLDEFPNAGHAKSFIRFLRDELVPFVEKAYNVDPKSRTIIGFSFSGLFISSMLFTDNDVFNRYVIVSPSLWWDNGLVFRYEADYNRRHKSLNTRLYVAVGENDGPNILIGFKRMEEVLEERKYRGLDYRAKLFPEETHRTVFPIAVSHGLRFVLAEKE